MKAFRGTLLAGLLLALVVALVGWLRPSVLTGEPEGHPQLFRFEKHALVRIDVKRAAGDDIALVETDGGWVIEATGDQAGRSMVNRVKHQIHDLTARATVVADAESAELYGLGANAIRVLLTLRDGETISFKAGDPNPTGVSYYIQPDGDDTIYTVKKSALDYYSLGLDDFRERRFVSFDSKDVTRLTAKLDLPEAKHTLDIEKVGDRLWEMRSPMEMAASDDQVRRFLGRVSALKARTFLVDQGADLSEFGLDHPRADIEVRFGAREPLRLRVGKDANADNRYEELAYVQVDGDDTIYVARRGLLETFAQDPSELRNRRVVRMKGTDVVALDAVLTVGPEDDLSGEGGVRYAAEHWVWKDGVPVSGSTPKRVARRLAELEVAEFIDEDPSSLKGYGLGSPRARVVLTDAAGNTRVVRIGKPGEPRVDGEGHERVRRYATVEGDGPVYLVDDSLLQVVKDLIRESNRKAKKDVDKAARRERIESVADEEGAP
jgi:hypothetical protein